MPPAFQGHLILACIWLYCHVNVYICFQGLGAPIGSIVAGPRDFIGKVLKIRKMLGGGMRQAGVIAAPGNGRIFGMVVN